MKEKKKKKKRKKIEEHYTRRLNTAALCLSGSLLNKSRYLSSHGDQIGNAGQTRRRGALRRRSTQTYILYRIRSERAVYNPPTRYRVWPFRQKTKKCSMQKMPKGFSILDSLYSLACIEFETLRLYSI